MNKISEFNPFDFSVPTKIRYAPNESHIMLKEIESTDVRDVGVVIDKGAKKNSKIRYFLDLMDKKFGICKIISYEGGEPTYEGLDKINSEFSDVSPKGVFAIGGGSVMDIGKAIAVLQTNPGPALKYRGFNMAKKKALPIITVPTVAGTGSEITPNASFVDDRAKIKLGINGECVRPLYAIIDPSFSLSCPKQAVLSSAVDSIVHSTEAYVAKKANSLSRFFAKEGFALACTSLEQALSEEQELEPRCKLALASLYAALAMMHSGTGPAAAMSYPMGVRYSVPHGFAGGIFLPFVAQITRESGCEIHQDLITGIETKNSNYPQFLSALWARVGMPNDIEKMGLTTEENNAFVEDTLKLSAALEQHPVPFEKKQILMVIDRMRKTRKE